jgi:hypothetical protein
LLTFLILTLLEKSLRLVLGRSTENAMRLAELLGNIQALRTMRQTSAAGGALTGVKF